MQVKSLSVLCIALAGTGVFAQAKPPVPDYTLAFNVGAVTDYRYRGISQSRFDPALQGGIDFTHKSGFYLGTWASSIKWIKDAAGTSSDAEIDIYGGYRGLVGGFSYDLGALRYLYPSSKLAVNPYTTELYVAGTYGIVTAKYSHAVTNTFGNANSKNSYYIEAAATFDLGNGWSVVPHIGHQDISGAGNGIFSYTDYSLALNKDFGNGLVASLTAVGTDARKGSYVVGPFASSSIGKNLGRDTLVLGLKYNF